MKKLFVLLLIISNLHAWEVTTHRAIDRTAILNSKTDNLHNFLNDSALGSYSFDDRDTIMFDGYEMTYTEYIKDGESNGISEHNQTFSNPPSPIDLIEAGTILEDAQWAGAWFKAYGRFLNHFSDPQNNYSGFPGMTGADLWAWGSMSGKNKYDYISALEYFKEGFSNPDPKER